MPDDDPTRPPLTDRATAHAHKLAHAAHDAIAPKINKAKKEHVTDLLETFERDLAPHFAPMLTEMMAAPEFPEVFRSLFQELTEPQNLTSSLIVGIGVGAILSPALGAAFGPFINELADQAWSKFPTTELTPNEAAAGVLKGVLTPAEARSEALTSGLNSQRMDWLVEISGQAIGVAEALLLWRRKQITDGELQEVIQYSNLNPKFYDMVPKLQYTPPGTGTVITGALKGHLTPAEARAKIAQAGTNPDEYEWLFQSSGRPPGMMQMLELLNRGEVGEARVRQAVRQSDVNTAYEDDVLALRWYVPPVRSIVPMLRHGGIDETKARALLKQRGVRDSDADAYVNEAHTTRTTAERTVTATQIIAAYEERIIPRTTAATRITSMHYTPADAELMLDLADARAKDRNIRAALGRVHGLYTRWRMTRAEAQTELGALNVPAADVAELLDVWTHERHANAPDLSVAQWQGALHREIISLDRFVTEMQTYGYGGVQVKILAAESFPPTKVPAAVEALNPASL